MEIDQKGEINIVIPTLVSGYRSKCSISIPIPCLRYRFLNNTFFDTNFMKSILVRFHYILPKKNLWFYFFSLLSFFFYRLKHSKATGGGIYASCNWCLLAHWCWRDKPLSYRNQTTRHFLILDSIESIQSVPKKYQTHSQALLLTCLPVDLRCA